MGRLTKKVLAAHINDRFCTVEFVNGLRDTYYGGQDMLAAIETLQKCAKKGNICFMFDAEYDKEVFKNVLKIEREIKGFVPLEIFRSMLADIIRCSDVNETALRGDGGVQHAQN